MAQTRGIQEFLLEITCERALVKQVVRVVLHAILFQRCLGPLQPRRLEICDLSFVAIDDLDHSLTNEVETHADAFARSFDTPSARTRKVTLSFYEKARPAPKPKAQTSWFPLAAGSPARDREDQPFETFSLEVTVAATATERERSRLTAITKAQLANFQLALLRFVNDHRAHIPAITKEGNPFPFEINVNPGGLPEHPGWVPEGLRRMLSEPA